MKQLTIWDRRLLAILYLVFLAAVVQWALGPHDAMAAQTHTFPATDTNNTFTGTNTFGPIVINGPCTGAVGCGGQIVTTIPIAGSYASKGTTVSVTNGANANDCTAGGGTTPVFCQYSGSAWAAVASSVAGNPGGSDTNIQCNKSGVFSGNCLLSVNSSTSPTQLNILGDVAFAGPRPYIDVTAPPYNCDPNSGADCTAGIQLAINDACAYSGNAAPAIYFPFGFDAYKVSQPQAPDNSPIFDLPANCAGLHPIGEGFSKQAPQFSRSPQAVIQVGHCGTPGTGPVFKVDTNANAITFENLAIEGCNQGVEVTGASGTTFKNTCVSNFGSGGTGLAANTALYLLDSVQFLDFYGGCITAGGPTAVLMQDDSSGTPIANINFYGTRMAGDGMEYLTTALGHPTGGGGDITLDHIVDEDCNAPLFSVVDSSGSQNMGGFGNLILTNPVMADCGATYPILQLNMPGDYLFGVDISLPQGSNSAAQAIQALSVGSIGFIHISGCGGFCTTAAVDGSGNPLAGVVEDNQFGHDYQVSAYAGRLRTDTIGFVGDPLRIFPSGVNPSFATLGLDLTEGLLFNQAQGLGYSGGVAQFAPNSVGIEFPTVLPPASVAAAPTTGGTLPNGTYYVAVYGEIGGSGCSGGTTESAPSSPVVPITLSGSNDAISVTWSLPTPNMSSDFCAVASSGPIPGADGNMPTVHVSSSSTNATIITNNALNPNPIPVAPMTEYHRYTYNAFGVNTTSPVPGTLTDNGGFVAQKNTYSSAHTLLVSEHTVFVTGTTTITVLHALPTSGLASEWLVINSGTNTVTLACDSGNINGGATVTLAANASGIVTADGTNCWEH